ncbi:MAG: response regulator [FCB group bacterium]|nr:response regulator [FCB group bacterium]
MSGKVLIIDDEPDVSTYLEMALQANGFEAQVANSVDDGMEKLDRFCPDLICLDIMMPKKSGLTFYTHLRGGDNRKHIPVIIISGVTTDGEFDIHSFVPDDEIPPPECFFEKPIDVEEFVRTVKRLIKSSMTWKGRKR